MFNVNEFSSTLSKVGGLQRNNLFAVEIPLPNMFFQAGGQLPQAGTRLSAISKKLHFFCEATNLPGIEIETSQVRRYGYGAIEEKPHNAIMGGLTLNFYGDARGAILNFFQQWMKFIVNFDSRGNFNNATGLSLENGSLKGNQFPYEVNYKIDYAVDITVNQFDQTGQFTNSVVCRMCFPKFMPDINLSWAHNDDFMKIPVNFSMLDFYNPNLQLGAGVLSFATAASATEVINTIDPTSGLVTTTAEEAYKSSKVVYGQFIQSNVLTPEGSTALQKLVDNLPTL